MLRPVLSERAWAALVAASWSAKASMIATYCQPLPWLKRRTTLPFHPASLALWTIAVASDRTATAGPSR